jgi:hypothetical protein
MLDLLIVLFVFSSLWISWLRPIYYAIKSNPSKEWLEYWVILGTVAFLEFHIFNNFSRQLIYNFTRTMTLFVISERAIVATKPLKKAEKKESVDELPFNTMPELIVHLENLNEKTQASTIAKLLSNNETVPFELEKTSIWTTPPRTVRGCTAYKLAVLVSGDKFFKHKLKELKDHNVQSILLDMLNSNDPGDRENALLAVCYLAEKSKALQQAFFEVRIFDVLIRIALEYTGQTVVAALRIFRTIFKKRPQAKEEIMRMRISIEIIKLIKSQDKEIVVEAGHFINDLVMKDENILNKALLQMLTNQGLYDAIQAGLSIHGADSKLKLQLKCLETLIKSI